MRLGQLALATVIAALCACGRPQPAQQRGAAPDKAPADERTNLVPLSRPSVQPPPARPATQAPVVDPKSTEAAEEIGRAFVGLINRGRFNDAYMLLGPNAGPRADFDRQFASWSDLRAVMGTAGAQEGAAGSSYLTVPVTLSGRLNGAHADRSINLVLRRVNDVPGSTEAQRHWHIERVDAAQL